MLWIGWDWDEIICCILASVSVVQQWGLYWDQDHLKSGIEHDRH